MKSILLAVQEDQFHQDTVRFALGLARRLKARLEVLQVVSPLAQKKWKKFKSRLQNAMNGFEDSMVAATFAEAGETEMATGIMTPPGTAAARAQGSPDQVDYDLHVIVGQPEKEVIRYLDEHHEVVLAVYEDGAIELGAKEDRLVVPVVKVNPKTRRPTG